MNNKTQTLIAKALDRFVCDPIPEQWFAWSHAVQAKWVEDHVIEAYESHTGDELISMVAEVVSSLLEMQGQHAVVPELNAHADSVMTIVDVCVPEWVEEYDDPEELPEWGWIQDNASYQHMGNGEQGVWEFVLNLGNDWVDIPASLKPIIQDARTQGVGYVLFHQGT